MDPGLGKTSTTLAAFKILKNEGYAESMLIIAPLRVCHNVWPQEIAKWDDFNDLTIEVLHGPDKDDSLERDADIYIINPEGLKWLFDPGARRWRDWDILCVDESTKFKDTQTQRFKLMRKHFDSFTRRWILTGTPIPNGVHDLFGQVFILDLGDALGRYVTHFRNKFFHTNSWEPFKYIPNDGAWDTIIERVDPLMLRMSEKEYLSLPRLIHETVPVEMPKSAWKVYNEIENDFITNINDGTIVAANAAVAGGKCRQICNGALYTELPQYEEIHSAKLDACHDLLEQLGGAPTIVVYEFRHDKERLLKRFGSATPVLGGGTTPKRTTQIIEAFNRGDVPVLLAQSASASLGLNLQKACHHMIWFGLTWNLQDYDQMIRRIYRQGQEYPVMNYHLLIPGTLDERVLDVLKSKDATQQTFFEALTND